MIMPVRNGLTQRIATKLAKKLLERKIKRTSNPEKPNTTSENNQKYNPR